MKPIICTALLGLAAMPGAQASTLFIEENSNFFPILHEGTVLKTLRQEFDTPPAIPLPDTSIRMEHDNGSVTGGGLTIMVPFRTGSNGGTGFNITGLDLNPVNNPNKTDPQWDNDLGVTFYRDNGNGVWDGESTESIVTSEFWSFRFTPSDLNSKLGDTDYVSYGPSELYDTTHLDDNTFYWMMLDPMAGDVTQGALGALTDPHYDAFGDWERLPGYTDSQGNVVDNVFLQYNLYVESGGTTGDTLFDGTDPDFIQKTMVPEPGAISLLGLGAAGLAFRRRRRA